MQEHSKFNFTLQVNYMSGSPRPPSSSLEPGARPCPLRVWRRSPPACCRDHVGRNSPKLPSRGAEEHNEVPGVVSQGSNGARRCSVVSTPTGHRGPAGAEANGFGPVGREV